MKKKYLLFVIISILLLVIITEVTWYYKQNGNLILYVSNELDSSDTIEIKILVDDTLVFFGSLSSEYLDNYVIVPLDRRIGQHKLTVNVNNGDAILEEQYFLLPVRWIMAYVVDGENIYGTSKKEIDIMISKRYSPIKLN